MTEHFSKTTGTGSEIVIYQGENSQSRIQVWLEGETVWLSQVGMAELYQTTVANINIHIKNILEDGELAEEATIKDCLIVRTEGARNVNRPLDYLARTEEVLAQPVRDLDGIDPENI